MNRYWTYNKGIVNPIIPGLDCQVNAMIIIGDGQFDKGTDSLPKNEAAARFKSQGILTFTVGYGRAVTQNSTAIKMYKDIAIAGGTHKEVGGSVKQQGFFVANTPADLKAVIDQIVQTIVAKTYSYSAPSISSEIFLIALSFVVSYLNETFLKFISEFLIIKLGRLVSSLIIIFLSMILLILLNAAAP